MSSFRLIPTFRLARRLAQEVSPWGHHLDRWAMGPWRYGGWGHHHGMMPFFGPTQLSRVLDEHFRLFDNLNRLEALWYEESHPEAQVDKASSGESNSSSKTEKGTAEASTLGQEVSPKEETKSDIFKVSLKLGNAFKPEEIKVRVIGRCLQVEGKHEKRGDDGHYVHRQFAHSYNLPRDVDDTNLVSTLSAQGILNIEAPRLQLEDVQAERHIPIQHEERSVEKEDTNSVKASAEGETESHSQPEADVKVESQGEPNDQK